MEEMIRRLPMAFPTLEGETRECTAGTAVIPAPTPTYMSREDIGNYVWEMWRRSALKRVQLRNINK